MNTLLEVDKFLEQSLTTPLVDVRTPAEYERGHIPGAINIPIFSDQERIVVGTLYKQKGKDLAVEKGLEFVGPKMASFVRQAKKIAKDKKILVHCWRGGMRSASMAWLFRTAGLEATCLKGGYKAYRTLVRSLFMQDINLLVLGGMTGSGKTEILHQLVKTGEQIIDLEHIAHHKGSAFGSLGQSVQPTSEQFDNNLYIEFSKLDITKRIWIEDESRSIGKVWLNEIIFEKIRSSRLVKLEIPKIKRIERLVSEYGSFDVEILKEQLLKISKRLGANNIKQAISDLDNNKLDKVANMSLRYYDKAYGHGLSKRNQNIVHEVKIEDNNTEKSAEILLNYCKTNNI